MAVQYQRLLWPVVMLVGALAGLTDCTQKVTSSGMLLGSANNGSTSGTGPIVNPSPVPPSTPTPAPTATPTAAPTLSPTAQPTPPSNGGTWTQVILPGANLSVDYGVMSVVTDPGNLANLYASVNGQGLWKSNDYGQTWKGPINTGLNGQFINCDGALSIASLGPNTVPYLMMMMKQNCSSGNYGFYLSKDGGISWTAPNTNLISASGNNGSFYHAVVDPYDPNHLLATGHEVNLLMESKDQGVTWTKVTTATSMQSDVETFAVSFVNTGSSATTRTTFLLNNTSVTYLTKNDGAQWTQVNNVGHANGDFSNAFYQPNAGGAIYLAGGQNQNSGIYVSSDLGSTWKPVGLNQPEGNVWGSSQLLYGGISFAGGPGGSFPPNLEMGSYPGTGTWISQTAPASMSYGPFGVATTFDGTHNIYVTANSNAGLWRYVEQGASKAAVWINITPQGLNTTSQNSGSQNPASDIAFDPQKRSTIYGMLGNSGIWKSTNAGQTWTQIDNLPKPASFGRIKVNPNNSNNLYYIGSVLGNSLGFWISNDGGSTFAQPSAFTAGVGTQWNQDVYNIAVDPSNFGHFLLTFHSAWPNQANNASGILEGVCTAGTLTCTFTSHNPWVSLPNAGSDLTGQGIAFLYNPQTNTGNSNTWLIGGGYSAGIYRTINSGASWTQVSTAQDNHGGFDLHYSPQGYAYIGTANSVLRSTDNGITWQSATSGLPSQPYYSALSDSINIYTAPSFVYQSPNLPFFMASLGGSAEGLTWSQYSTQILPEGPFRMTFDSVNNIIYSANWEGGLWKLAP